MQAPGGPLCELAVSAPADAGQTLDRWLDEWVAEGVSRPEVVDARLVLPDEDEGDDRHERRILLFLATEAKPADSCADIAAAMRAALPQELRGRVRVQARALRSASATSQAHCANCNALLYGQYCGTCGQRARHRIISLWELLRDAAGDLFELDSRLWRTLIPLAIRPGLLTSDYLQGRRARYMPPFRMYLVLSLLFFVAASLDDSGLMVVSEDQGAPAQATAANCAGLDLAGIEQVGLLGMELSEERVRQVCERIVGDGGQAFTRALFDNLAVALYVLLPLMAMVLKLLYPLSRRYYVEHLLFVVHVHAFFFLVLLVQLALDAVAQLPGGGFAAVPAALVAFYALYYPYGGMRRVYSQGRLATLVKYVLLVATYLASFGLMMAVAAVIAAISL